MAAPVSERPAAVAEPRLLVGSDEAGAARRTGCWTAGVPARGLTATGEGAATVTRGSGAGFTLTGGSGGGFTLTGGSGGAFTLTRGSGEGVTVTDGGEGGVTWMGAGFGTGTGGGRGTRGGAGTLGTVNVTAGAPGRASEPVARAEGALTIGTAARSPPTIDTGTRRRPVARVRLSGRSMP